VQDTGRGVSALGRGVAVGVALLALLTATCNLQSASPASVGSTNLKIALIGDSIAAHLAKDLRNPSFGGPTGVTWAITAQPGAGWGEGEDAQGNWPLGVVQGDTTAKRVRAAAKKQPSAIVIELGTNDALRASFAYSLNNGSQLSARIVGTDNNIRRVVKLASSLSRCVVLVSPSYYPTGAFGEQQHYSATALQLRTVLLTEVSRAPKHTVVVADWAALSSTHRLAAGSSGNWFTPDGLHPNISGLRALADLIVRMVRSCPL
jgi:lysophospholipase L1-like esterase